MPYKGVESFRIEEECVKKWAYDLRPTTARNYVYNLLRYLDWVEEKGYWSSAEEMIREAQNGDRETLYRHLDVLLEYIKGLGTGVKDRRNRYQAVRSFYEYYRADLPRPSRQELNRVFQPSEADKLRALTLPALTIEELREIIIHAPQPYKAAFMVCFQGALGASEYDQFNSYAWYQIVDKLDSDEPVRVDLFRSKVSRTEIKKYYTFLGGDSKVLIKAWLKERPECDREELFVVYNRRKKEYVPLTSRLLGNMLTKIAKRLEIIKPNGLNRYHVHLHEFRDLFKSLCTLHGVNAVASEFFLGHVIDKLGYDKSPEYDVEWFRQEYMKVEPVLNILSNVGAEAIERAKQEVRAEFNKALEAVVLENQELKKKLEKLEKAVKAFMEIAMEDPEALPVLKEFLKGES
ncbi:MULTISPECIES: hypothetical protein [unclassified Archaeoglobus]|jgi:integrase|uniref:hypothetical protein n=1 Tax=unclassified Archaeoglobus TaxID=2643606 RepID=UPI0025B9D8D9|nr:MULTISPECIES: hypothetical protein [unclassified Archaeoglobus]